MKPEFIDLTSKYDMPEYQSGGRPTLDRGTDAHRVIAIVDHHAAGWYGRPLGPGSTRAQEEAMILAMARDQNLNPKLGMGPAYNYVTFPYSNRVYAVGKVGVRHPHCAGPIAPEAGIDGSFWNVNAIAICAMGNYDTEPMTEQLALNFEAAHEEIRGWPFSDDDSPVFPHGTAPGHTTQTACPGRDIRLWVEGLWTPEPEPPPPPVQPPILEAEILREVAVIEGATANIRGLLSGSPL